MRSRTEALNGVGVSEVLILLTTISVPRAFNPTSQLFAKPREMPTSATTAAIPMEIPISVNPVRTRRRINPRATTVRKLMSALRRTVHESAVLHQECSRGAPSDPQVVRDEYDGHLLLFVNSRDQVKNEPGADAVKITRGFIGEENRRAISQTASYGDALPFASGQFGWEMVEPMFQTHRLEKFTSASRSLR